MKKQIQLQELVHQLVEAKREHDRLVFDEEFPQELGEPCSPEQITSLEDILGRTLPPSYRAFLELHNGWSDFAGEAKLLAVEDHRSKWVKERIKSLGDLFDEFEDEDPFKEGAIPILLGKDERNFLVLDRRTIRPNGEMDFVSFDLTREENRFEDFTSFLRHDLKLTQKMIENEKKGIAYEDDENED